MSTDVLACAFAYAYAYAMPFKCHLMLNRNDWPFFSLTPSSCVAHSLGASAAENHFQLYAHFHWRNRADATQLIMKYYRVSIFNLIYVLNTQFIRAALGDY